MTLTIGIMGAILVLVAFILNQTGRWKNNFLIYDAVNFVGGALLIAYGLLISSYPFVVLNSVWTLFSLRDTINDIKKLR